MHEIVRRLDVDFIVRSGTVDIDNLNWMGGSIFLKTAFSFGLTPDDVAFDFGAHIGSFSLPLARRHGCRTYGFEPDMASLKLAQASALVNGLDGIAHFLPHGVGGSDGTVQLFESDETWGHTIVAGGGPANRLTGRSVEISVMSLASALAVAGDARRRLVKVNTEGAEFDMFEQASLETLRLVDCFVGEVHFDLGRPDFSPCEKRLQDAGFMVSMLPDGGSRAMLVAVRR
jgi:FkbM family methyltransferase